MKRPALAFDAGAARRQLRRWADRIGPIGMIGVAILATCAGYFAGSIEPQRAQLQALRASLDAPPEARPARAASSDVGTQLLQFAAEFPQERDLADLLGRLYAVGEREGVRLSQGEYRFIEPDALGMVQYKIALPVVASYPAMRRFVAAALSEIPSAAITQINLQRERIGQGQLEARIEMTLYLRAGRTLSAGSAQTPADVSRAPQIGPLEVSR
jgi:hypothetical protein